MWAIVEKSGNNALLSQRIVLQPFTWPTVGTYGLRGGGLKHNLMFSGGFYCSFIWETRKNIRFDMIMRLTPPTGTLKFLAF